MFGTPFVDISIDMASYITKGMKMILSGPFSYQRERGRVPPFFYLMH